MHALLVVNPKGGSGKTTLATNLAAGLAHAGETVYLWDIDRQKSALTWLAQRSPALPSVHRLDSRDKPLARPESRSWVVIDTPAGLHGKSLEHALTLAHKILVPVVPSMFDMAATRDFLDALLKGKGSRRKHLIGIVAMRVDARTRAAATLEAFLRQYELPILAHLRDTVLYVNSAFTGQSIFDLPAYLTERDLQQWVALIEWVRGTSGAGA